MEVLVKGFQERSRLKMMTELRKFITVDNHEAVKICDLEKTLESHSVVKPKCAADFAGAVVREGTHKLTVRREEEGLLHNVDPSLSIPQFLAFTCSNPVTCEVQGHPLASPCLPPLPSPARHKTESEKKRKEGMLCTFIETTNVGDSRGASAHG